MAIKTCGGWSLNLMGTLLRSGRFLVPAPVQTKHGRRSGRGRCQNTFRAPEVPLSKVLNPQSFIYAWTKVNWATVTPIYARSPNAYLYRSSSLLHWAMGPHTGVRSSLVIKCPHNSGGMECVRAVEMKVKPPWKSYTLRTAVLYSMEMVAFFCTINQDSIRFQLVLAQWYVITYTGG